MTPAAIHRSGELIMPHIAIVTDTDSSLSPELARLDEILNRRKNRT